MKEIILFTALTLGSLGTTMYNTNYTADANMEQLIATQKAINKDLKTIRYNIALQDSAVQKLSVEVQEQSKQVRRLKNIMNNENRL